MLFPFLAPFDWFGWLDTILYLDPTYSDNGSQKWERSHQVFDFVNFHMDFRSDALHFITQTNRLRDNIATHFELK